MNPERFQNMRPQSNSKQPSSDIQNKLAAVSAKPGVYIMKDAGKKVIYVGKARNLKKRLASYFGGRYSNARSPDIKTEVLINKTADFETIITRTEKEALILESNLIKRHKPRYNVILKDDKRYPSLRLDTKSPYPNLTIVRKIEKDGVLYFGPFTSASAVHQTLKIIHKTFKLRKCKTKAFTNRSRPCLNHQMDACLAPCCLKVPQARYKEIVREVILFLKGRTPELIKKIKAEMLARAKVQDYEKAARLRDKLFALEKTLEKQVAVTTDFVDRDVLAIARSAEYDMLTILFLRGGFLLGTRHFSFAENIATEAEIVGDFIRQYYEKTPFVPKEILVPTLLPDAPLLEELLSGYKGQNVRIHQPQRGAKVRLVKMAMQNAQDSLKNLTVSIAQDQQLLLRLQQRLKMDRIPKRIECVDNSNLAGTEPVAALVVFENARPQKSLYRKYKIKTVAVKDDYASMAEILKRRFGNRQQSKPYPDLLLVDGGKGHLNIAVAVVKELKVDDNIAIIGIAKKDNQKREPHDKIYKPGQANPVNWGREGDLLLFLQSIRDEAHRFAISFHRRRRSKTMLRSSLDSIPGIGKKRKAALLKHFGSTRKIKAASIEQLSAVPGISHKVAENVNRHIRQM